MVWHKRLARKTRQQYPDTCTNHVARATVGTKEIFLIIEGARQSDEELGATLEAGEPAARTRLKASFQLVDGQGLKAHLVHLGLVVGIARKDTL